MQHTHTITTNYLLCLQVRTAVQITIPVINPLDIPVKLAVRYGHDALVGPLVLSLPPKTKVCVCVRVCV